MPILARLAFPALLAHLDFVPAGTKPDAETFGNMGKEVKEFLHSFPPQ